MHDALHNALHKELLDSSLAEYGLPGCSSFEAMQRFQSGSKFREWLVRQGETGIWSATGYDPRQVQSFAPGRTATASVVPWFVLQGQTHGITYLAMPMKWMRLPSETNM